MFMFENQYITALFILISIYYVYSLWKNRHLYYYGSKFEGGLSLPVIGNTYLLLGNTNDIFNKLLLYYNKYQGLIVKFWFCNYLCIIPKEPKYFEMLLKGYMDKPFFYEIPKLVYKNGLLTAPVTIWKNHRKIINQTFNQNILSSFVEIFNKYSTKFLKDVKENSDIGHIDIFPLIFRHSLNTLCETMMGITSSEFNELDDFVSQLMRIQELSSLRMLKPWRNLFWKLIDGKKLKADNLEIEKFVKKVIRLKRLEKNQREPDKKYFLDYLINLENEKLTDHKIFEETKTMMVAGSETVATTLCFVILMMALYPEIQEEAYKEVSEILKEYGSVTYSNLNEMKYLDRIIKETLRLFPIVPLFARVLHEDVHLGSIPTFFVMALHRNPEFWPDPLKFNPDRFLPEEIAKRPSGCYIPFSTGPRNCIGFKYAEISMKIFLAHFIKGFKIRTTQYKVISDIKLLYKITLMAKDGFKFELKKRQ